MIATGIVYGVVLVLFALIQRSLLYFPTHHRVADELRIAARAGLEPRVDERRGVLSFLAPHPVGAEATWIVAHGNAGTALDRTYFVDLVRRAPTPSDVVLVEYPGYGAREGEPDEAANVAAVVEAIDAAKANGRPIVLLGESLGSAVVALAAAQRRDDVSAMVLVTPLPRLALVAAHHYPFIPTILLADRYEADAAIARFAGPVAFVVARHDEVIPAPLGLAMHAGYRGPKLLEIDDEATHNSVDYDPTLDRWRRVFDFVDDAIRSSR